MLNEYVSFSKNQTKKFKDSSFYVKHKIETIELRNISFGYPNKEIFNKINLSMKLGEKILIKGKSGSGKTTLINLITGLLNPTGGEICINNDPKLKANYILQQYTAYIPQQTFIIDDSIKNNIAFGQFESELDKLALQKAINQSSLGEYIDSLQYKINTKVGEEGARISGGQRQRIALARAFYFNKKIIILDESTNSLDKKTENMILNEILRKSEDKIIILISHGDHDELSFDRKLIIKEKNILENNSMDIELYIIILFVSIIQALFGVGVLLFGTPLLLIWNYPFKEVLIILLPISLTISFSQVLINFKDIDLNFYFRIFKIFNSSSYYFFVLRFKL